MRSEPHEYSDGRFGSDFSMIASLSANAASRSSPSVDEKAASAGDCAWTEAHAPEAEQQDKQPLPGPTGAVSSLIVLSRTLLGYFVVISAL